MSHLNRHLFAKLLVGVGCVFALTLLSAVIGPRPSTADTVADNQTGIETASAQR
jgi:hypothetical protein